MAEEPPRRLAAVWFADIAGYTDLSARDEDAALRTVRELQRIARTQCHARGGRVVKLVGDAVLAVFDSADGAAWAAMAVRDAFLQSRETLATGVSIRVGLHLGDVTESIDGDVHGEAVDAVSLIERAAQPGQVVLSDVAYRLLQQRSEIDVEELGKRELQGIGPMRLYAVRPLDRPEAVDQREALQEALAPLQLLDVEGMGGMGEVYLARDPELRRTLAVKVLRSELVTDKEARARFSREAQVIAGLSHPNVIGIHSVGELKDGTPYFVMDYVEGGSLAGRVEAEGPLTVRDARRVIGEVASALHAAHSKGVVHRDIKASNILYDIGSDRVLVTDWGIAALDPTVEMSPETRVTRTGVVIGSPQYMSPEQLAGDQVTEATDLYSLGLLAYEILIGAGPFEGDTPHELLVAHLRDVPEPLSKHRESIDPEFESIVAGCLEKDAGRRPTAEEVAQRLNPASGVLLEWPPPGLEQLRETYREAYLILRAAVLFPVVALLIGLSLGGEMQPAGGGALLPFLAGTVLFLAGSVGVVCVLGTGVQWMKLARSVYRALGTGTGWITLVEVMADSRGDTGALTAGTREYASLTPRDRGRYRRNRALILILEMATVAVLSAVSMLALWLLPRSDLTIPGVWGLVLGVMLVSAFIRQWVRWVETRAVKTARMRIEEPQRPRLEALDLMATWRRSFQVVGRDQRIGEGPSGMRALGHLGAVVVIAGATLISMVAMPLLFLAVINSATLSFIEPDLSRDQEEYEQTLLAEPFRSRADPGIDALTAGQALYAILADEEYAGTQHFLPAPTQQETVWHWPQTPVSPFGPDMWGATHGVQIQVGEGFSPEQIAFADSLLDHPIFDHYPGLAKARRVDLAGAMLRFPLASSMSIDEILSPSYSRLADVSNARLLSAALQLSRGRTEEAETTIREVISVGILISEEALGREAFWAGRRIVKRGMDDLEQLYVLVGREEDAGEVDDARNTQVERREDLERLGESLMSTRLSSRRARRLLQDSTVARPLKWEVLKLVSAYSSCGSLSAILQGPPVEVEGLFEYAMAQLARGPAEEALIQRILDVPPFRQEAQSMFFTRQAARLLENPRIDSCVLFQ